MKLFYYLVSLFTIATNAFSQSAQQIPAKIEAENFASISGVTTETCNDEGGGFDIGWMQTGSWTEYTILVPSSGYYSFQFRIANGFSDNAKIQILSSASVVTESILPRTGGMQSWSTVRTVGYLPAGNQTIRLFAQTGVFAVNWLSISSPKEIPSKIQAENYDQASDVRIESVNDNEAGQTVSYIDNGDWLDFNISLATAGTQYFDFRVSNSWGDGLIKIKDAGGNVLSQIDVPRTGGWDNYTTITTSCQLPAGNQTIRIFAERGLFNFNWMEVRSAVAPKPKGVITFSPIGPISLSAGAFLLTASSSNGESPIHFVSSDSSTLSLKDSAGIWTATALKSGAVTVTASQAASDSYAKADDIARNITIQSEPAAPGAIAKITLDPARWYQLNNTTIGLQGLFDGITSENVQTGWGKVLDSYEAYYPLNDSEQMTLTSVKFFDFEGSSPENPMILSVITDQWERVDIASFKGYEYGSWVGPYPDRNLSGDAKYLLDNPVGNIRYLVLKIRGLLPTEMELYGTQTGGTSVIPSIPTRNTKLESMFGVNGYEWNFEDGNNPTVINEAKMTAAKNFSGFRHYMDWERLEATEGSFSFNPTISGGWNYDAIYERCKAENIEVLACLKTIPNWMQATYPVADRDMENVPLRFGKNFSDPLSYIEQAKVGFQYAARYGSNTNVDPTLLHLNTTPRWNGDAVNVVKIGLNLVKYIECDNERDKWWKGRKAYQTAREYAANLSAFYDGHKNTLGPGVGVKNADPNMKVVIAGLVTGADYVRAMIDWCKEFRGYNPDGSVNLCWDIINFHIYPDDGNSMQSGTSTRGAAIETTHAAENLESFRKVAHELCGDMPVWITEVGYDINQGSPLKAIPVGSKSVLETQADWLLRTSLFAARHGIDKVFFYQMYDDSDGGGMFATSGLLNANQTRRPAADYIHQVKNKFGAYYYQETLHSDPIVDRYERDGQSMYMLVIPDETGRTANYSLQLPGADSAIIYIPMIGSDEMTATKVAVNDNQIAINVSETPLFVTPIFQSSTRQSGENILIDKNSEQEKVKNAERVFIYPNPATQYVVVSGDTQMRMEVRIFDAHSGRLFKNRVFESANTSKKIELDSLPVGIYVVEIKQGTTHEFRKLAKN